MVNVVCRTAVFCFSSLSVLLTFTPPLLAQSPPVTTAQQPDTTVQQSTVTQAPAAELHAPPAPAPAAPGGLKIDGAGASIKLGFLLQPAYEFTDQSPTADEASQTFFLRRARLMVGMSLGSMFELFVETETANLGRAAGPAPGGGVASTVGANIQDAFITWKPLEQFKLDAGLILIPLSHNGLQGATTLYSWDYYAYSFQQNGALGNYVGRDTGVQVRGLLFEHLEYRLGAFTGRRVVPAPMMMEAVPMSRTALRVAGRVQYNFFDAESGFFYAGTYHGAKRVLSVGGGFDLQSDYRSFAGDVFLDWPLGTNVVTAQADVVRYDGGTWAPIPTQTSIMTEAGYRIGNWKLSPIVRFELLRLDAPSPQAPDFTRLGAGLAYWYMGHNANVKAFYSFVRAETPGQNSYSQVNLQMQFFVF
jgi:hypothetical protein